MSAALAEALGRVLPAGLAVGWADPRVRAPVWPGEAIAAVPARQAEFAAGRWAARAAMAALGLRAEVIPMGADRAPVWPLGVVGSISHSASACLAVVGRAEVWDGIGLDIEPATALAPELWAAVLLADEQAELGAAAGLQAKRIFTAKEAAYKAQYAASGALFGFDGLRIGMGLADFSATFTQAVLPFAAGHCLRGVHFAADGHLVSLVVIAAAGEA